MSSTPVPKSEASRKTPHSRRTSAQLNPQDVSKRPGSPSTQSTSSKMPTNVDNGPKVHYTAFIRLPFPRASFEDPPLVEWDAVKDKQLWKLISKASSSRDLNWEQMAENFGVGLNFLLMQAAWLYERHFEGMKKQMMRLGGATGASGTSSPLPSGGEGGTGSMKLRPLSINAKDAQPMTSAEQSSTPATPRLPSMSRTPSTRTVTQSRVSSSGQGERQPIVGAFRTSSGSQRRPLSAGKPVERSFEEGEPSKLQRSDASGSESGEGSLSATRTQHYSRRMHLLGRKPMASMALSTTVGSDGDVEDDEDDSSGHLPFAAASTAATIQGSPRRQTAALHQPAYTVGGATQTSKRKTTESSMSSFSSSSAAANRPAQTSESESGASNSIHKEQNPSNNDRQQNRPGPLSPKQKAELAKLSPRYKKDGSDGTPSMGSSFSDLDDASVTQSALEEALLSNMRQGGSVVSRVGMGSLRDVLRRT